MLSVNNFSSSCNSLTIHLQVSQSDHVLTLMFIKIKNDDMFVLKFVSL